MAAPSMSLGASGNALSSQALGAGANQSFTVDLSTAFEGQLQVSNTGGATVAATNGLKVEVYPRVGSTPVNDTVAGAGSVTIATVASTLANQTIKLQTGRYNVKLTNLDVTNGITVAATLDLLNGIA